MARTVEALALLSAILLSGCASTAPGPQGADADDAPGEPIEVEPGVWIGKNRGALRGVVRNDAGLPVEKVRVSLLGTDLFQDTRGGGAFLFLNLTAGEARLRAAANGYTAWEETVLLTRGNVTNVTIHLLPDASRGAGYAPHVHDFWGGGETYLLMDADRTFASPDKTTRTANMNESAASDGPWRIQLPLSEKGHPSIILPGTREIRITLTWTASSTTLSRLGVTYWMPIAGGGSPRIVGPAASGQTLRIAVPAEEADTGHQVFSFWSFFLCPCNDVRGGASYQPAVFNGPIHIKMELVKGEVVLEPAHPDFWGSATRKVLASGDWRTVSYTNVKERGMSACQGLLLGTLVPPGTTRLLVELRWKYATANATALDAIYRLTWRTGDQDPARTGFADLRRQPPSRSEDHYVAYDVKLDAAHPDSFYQKRSTWCWLPSVQGRENESDSHDLGRGLQTWLRVEAFREPA